MLLGPSAPEVVESRKGNIKKKIKFKLRVQNMTRVSKPCCPAHVWPLTHLCKQSFVPTATLAHLHIVSSRFHTL